MKRSYEWADELVIICMAIFLGKDILQISHNTKQENHGTQFLGRLMDGQPRSRNVDPLRMANINPLHFEALECIHHAVGDAYQCSDCQKTFSNNNDLYIY